MQQTTWTLTRCSAFCLQADVCDAAGMTPAQLAAGSAFAALLPAAEAGAATTCSERPCSRCNSESTCCCGPHGGRTHQPLVLVIASYAPEIANFPCFCLPHVWVHGDRFTPTDSRLVHHIAAGLARLLLPQHLAKTPTSPAA